MNNELKPGLRSKVFSQDSHRSVKLSNKQYLQKELGSIGFIIYVHTDPERNPIRNIDLVVHIPMLSVLK
jgi:hypothetical protein